MFNALCDANAFNILKYNTLSYVLQNERYSGNALLQKRYTTQTLPYQKKRNNGEKDQYFVTGSNQPIISQEIFDAAQSLMRKRAQKIITGTEVSLPLAMKLQCGCCGALRFLYKGIIINHNKNRANLH